MININVHYAIVIIVFFWWLIDKSCNEDVVWQDISASIYSIFAFCCTIIYVTFLLFKFIEWFAVTVRFVS